MDITLLGGSAEEFSRGFIYRGLAKALEMGTFLHRGPVKYHGRSVHWELQEIVERGLWKWGISLYGSSVRGTWREGSFVGDPVGYERKALEMGTCLHGAQLGNLEWAHLTRTEIWLRGAVEVERLSL
jgi:hypothetical protein